MLAGVVLIAATGIVVNALVLQSARHPAPLFAAVEQARIEAARRAAAPPPQPPARPPAPHIAAPAPTPPAAVPAPARPQPQQQAQPPSEPQSLARMMAEAAEKPAKPEKPAKVASAPDRAEKPARPAPIDPLGDMIRGGIVPPGGIPSEADPKIELVQRALAKRGASVKPDGFMGPATRAAIEKFERERKWTVTGEVSPRLLRELGTVSASRP